MKNGYCLCRRYVVACNVCIRKEAIMKNIFFFLFSFLSLVVFGQNINHSAIFPGPRGGAFIYHPGSKALLLFGNEIIPDTTRKDVWKWDGSKWTRIEAFGPGWIDFSQGISL